MLSETVANNQDCSYRKLFIVGCPRSGTSWLQQMLVLHPETIQAGVSPHLYKAGAETHLYKLIYKPFTFVPKMSMSRRLKQPAWYLKHYGLIPILFGSSSSAMWEGIRRSYRIYRNAGQVGPHTVIDWDNFNRLIDEVRQLPLSDIERAKKLIELILDHFFQKVGGQSHNLLVEKTPMHISCTDVILRQFPEAKAIIVTRDGRDVCASWQARSTTQKWARRDTTQLIHQWKRCVSLTQKFQADPEISARLRVVKYEDLRNNPTVELEAMLQFLELDHTSEQVQAYVEQFDIQNISEKGEGKHIRQGIVGDWMGSLSVTDIHLWHDRAKDDLLSMGYTM